MSLGSITSTNMNASYPKYLEQKKKAANMLWLSGLALSTSACAAHFTKAPIAVKHPWILFAGSALGLLGTVFGVSKSASIGNELKKYTQESQPIYLTNSDRVEISSKPKMSEKEAKFVISMCVNPASPNAMFYLPRLEEAREAIKYYQKNI